MKRSQLTFIELSKNLCYIKVVWNSKIVFDDTDGELSLEDYKKFEVEYANKIVYSMKVNVVEFHHCILYIRGEK